MVGPIAAVRDILNTEIGSPEVLTERQIALSIWDDTVDRYSGFDHRAHEGRWTNLGTPPWWVRGQEDKRRLVSYNIAKAMHETVERFFHERTGPDSDYHQNRERGHAAVLISRTADGIIGEEPSIEVEGAEKDVPPQAVLPDPPELPDGADEVQRLAHQAALAFYTEQGKRAVAEWAEMARRQVGLRDRLDWLQAWAETDSFWRKLTWLEEEHTVAQGDGVFVFSIDPNTNMPSVDYHEPDIFFKVPDPSARTEHFPDRVHLVWEYTRDNGPNRMPDLFVRRITYELFDVERWPTAYGQIANRRCFWSDASWLVTPGLMTRELRDSDYDTFPLNEAIFATTVNPITGQEVQADRVPLEVDFIPVVHFRNTGGGNYGRSELARRVALLDDMVSADTAAALVSILCGEPPISIKDGTPDSDIEFGPAAAIAGDAVKIGFAQELLAIIEYTNMIERQFVKVTGLSSELAGRENREQSGRAIGLKMTPYRQLITKARQAREDQAKLCMKFVQRLALVAGSPGFTGTEVYPARIRWGTFIPEDQSELVEQIIALRDRGLLTNEDVYDWLIAAGFSFRNPTASLAFLRSIDVKTAEKLAAIIGHEPAAEYLGRPLDEDTVPALKESDDPFGGGGGPAPSPGGPSSNQLPRRERSQPTRRST